MVSTLIKRIERAEQEIGDSPCERCRNTTVVFGPGSVEPAVNRRGVQFGREESKRFWAQEQPNNICPKCGRAREQVTVRWGPGSSAQRA